MIKKYMCRQLSGMLLALAALTAVTGCGRNGRGAGARRERPAQVVSAVSVGEGFVSDELVLNGSVACDEGRVSKVFVPCSGKVQGVSVEVGDHVSRGQLLASVFSQEAAGYDKQLSDANTEIRLARRELDMKQDMLRGGMASGKDVDEARARLDMALAEQARLRSVAGVNGFSRQAHAALRAPVAGYVYSKNVYDGSYVDDTNNDAPAFEIADLATVWVLADVYESDIRKVAPGARVRVTVLAYPDTVLAGCIDKIYRSLDAGSKTMKVRVRLGNAGGLLMPGMFASVHVQLAGQGRRMMTVPARSVVFENGNNYVVVADGAGKWRRQQVTVAHQDGSRAYIVSGVGVGQRVADKNALLIYNTLK